MTKQYLVTTVLALSVSAPAFAAPASCPSFDSFTKTCNLTQLGGECIAGIQKGATDAWNKYIVQGWKDLGKMGTDSVNYMSHLDKNLPELQKNTAKGWSDFLAGTQKTGAGVMNNMANTMAYMNSGAAQKDVQSFFGNAWKSTLAFQKTAGKAMNDTITDIAMTGGAKTQAQANALAAATGKAAIDGVKMAKEAKDTMMAAMVQSLAQMSYESGCQKVASLDGRGSRSIASDLLLLLEQEARAEEAKACKVPFKGCPECSAVKTAVCWAATGTATIAAYEAAMFLAPASWARYGGKVALIAKDLTAVLAKSGAWGGKIAYAATKAVAGAEAADKAVEVAHAAGGLAKAGAGHAAVAAQAVANNEHVQNAAAAVGKGMEKFGNLPGIKQFNKLQDNIAEAVLDGGEKLAFTASGGKIKPESLMMKNKLTDFMAKNPTAKLVPTNHAGQAGLDLVKDGKVVESFDATNAAGKPMTWDEFEERHGKDLEKVAGKAKMSTADVLKIPNVPKRQLVTGENVKGRKDSKYIKPMTDAQKNALIGKIGRKPSPGETLANEMAALSENGGKKMAYTEKLPRNAEDDMAHLFRDGDDMTEITEEGLMAADRGIINEAREKKGLPPLKEESVEGLDDAAKRAKHEKMLKEQPEEVTEEAEQIAKSKAKSIKDCEECIKAGKACPLNVEKLIDLPGAGH